MTQNAIGRYSIAMQPVVELACSTWMGAERLLRRHVMRGRLVLPPTEVAEPGPVIITVTLPTGEVLTFDAEVVSVLRGEGGEVTGTEVRFAELTESERQELEGYLETGASLPPPPPGPTMTDRKSGFHVVG